MAAMGDFGVYDRLGLKVSRPIGGQVALRLHVAPRCYQVEKGVGQIDRMARTETPFCQLFVTSREERARLARKVLCPRLRNAYPSIAMRR